MEYLSVGLSQFIVKRSYILSIIPWIIELRLGQD